MTIVINGTTGISGVDGSAGTPAVQGTDTNTGVFFPAADTIAFSTGGTEDMRIDSAGRVGIGVTPQTGRIFSVGGSMTGATGAYGSLTAPTVQPDVTANALISASQGATAANGGTPYTITNLVAYTASQGTFNADSTVTTQVGFNATAALIGATNNYGFQGNIASGTGRYNLYMSGTADNYLAGKTGIGTTPATGQIFRVGGSLTGATTARQIASVATVASDVTARADTFLSLPATAASAFTLGILSHYHASQGTIGATSAVTTQYGFEVDNSLTGATNNYGFYGNIASGTGRYNLYMNGTADNYFAGNVGIGTSSPGYKLDVQSSASSGAPLMANFQSAGGDPQLYISNGTVKTQLTADATNSASIVGSFSNHPLIIRTNNAEVGRFDNAGLFKFNSGYGSVATAYGCRVWVNFSGVGSTSIRSSGNVSSVTYNSAGKYTINFSSALVDANYAVVCGICGLGTSGGGKLLVENSSGTGGTLGRSTSSVVVLSTYSFTNPGAGTDDNSYSNSVAIFR